MSLFKSHAWSEHEQRYHRALVAGWITLIIAAFVVLITAEATIGGYTLEELTTHSSNGLILKGYAQPGREEYTLFIGYMVAFSLAVGITAGVMSRLLLSHWPSWVLAVVITGIPAVVASGLVLFWLDKAPELLHWGIRQISLLAAAQAVASLVGTLLGRPLARLLVKAFVPPKFRNAASFLWDPQAATAPLRPAYWRDEIGRGTGD